MRVIAGSRGGRRLVAPKGRHTRPTSDRVREAMFGMLGDVTGLSTLDLYAGSGALGIEALSRGASHATFVERAGPALAALRANLRSLELAAQASVIAQPVARAGKLLAANAPYDLVLADPPYADLVAATRVLTQLLMGDALVAGDARIVLEHASRDAAPAIGSLVAVRTRKYGDTAVSCYVVAPPS